MTFTGQSEGITIHRLWLDLKIAVDQSNPNNFEEVAPIPVDRWAKPVEPDPERLAAVIAAKSNSTK